MEGGRGEVGGSLVGSRGVLKRVVVVVVVYETKLIKAYTEV
jgi:hypothetical protein